VVVGLLYTPLVFLCLACPIIMYCSCLHIYTGGYTRSWGVILAMLLDPSTETTPVGVPLTAISGFHDFFFFASFDESEKLRYVNKSRWAKVSISARV
jgi:hypothetical protein